MKDILLSLLLLITPCYLTAQDNTQARKDSLRNRIVATEGAEKLKTYEYLTNIYYMESAGDDLKMDTLLALYQAFDAEALRQKNYVMQGLIRNNTIGAYINRNAFDDIFRLSPDYLAYLAKNEIWQDYYSIYMKTLQAYLRTGEYAKAIEGAKQMYNEAKQRNHNDGKGMALYVLSSAYCSMSRFEEGEKDMKECVETIKSDDKLLWLTAQAYFRLCNALIALKRYDEAWRYAQEFEKINRRYEEVSKFKQPTSWVNLWRIYMQLYFKNKDYGKTEIFCNKLDSMNASPFVQCEVYSMRSRICYERKQYDMALKMADKAGELSGGDPISVNENRDLKIMILCAQKGMEHVYDLVQQMAILRDSIRNTDFNAHLDELRTVYEVDKITAEKKHNRNYFLFALGGCVFLIITLGIRIYYYRIVTRKNKALYLQIKEQDRLVAELKQATAGNSPENLSDDRQQQQLVAHFSEYLLNERNYTKPETNLDELISALATNRTYLFEAVKAVTNKTPVEYIRSLRLEEAKQMLETRLDLNIETIAENCGFNSRSTFYRLFHEYYQISPAEYRSIAKKS